jgi:hypothetical protein
LPMNFLQRSSPPSPPPLPMNFLQRSSPPSPPSLPVPVNDSTHCCFFCSQAFDPNEDWYVGNCAPKHVVHGPCLRKWHERSRHEHNVNMAGACPMGCKHLFTWTKVHFAM